MTSVRDEYLELDDAKLLAQCEVHTYRASGPGGQKRNKTDSAVRLHHRPTRLITQAEESRSQHENKARALRRLRLTIALHQRTEVCLEQYAVPEVFASCLSRDGKISVGRRDARYPRVVAVVMDVLAANHGRVKDSADLLGATTGNLGKFIAGDPKLWEAVNRLRQSFGLDRLKSPT